MPSEIALDDKILHLATSPSDKTYVMGGKCQDCGEIIFPRKTNCLKCSGTRVETIPLSTEGEVYCSTSVHYNPPLYKGPMPYVIGEVLVKEGAVIQTPFTGCDMQKPLPIGTRVKLVLDSVGEDEKGNKLMVHKFKPV